LTQQTVAGSTRLPGGTAYPNPKLTAWKKAAVLAAAFLLPLIGAILIFKAQGMYPFGEKSLLIMDMSGQYVEFLCGLKHLKSPADMFFNWGKVLGSNYTGVFSYYCASPLSLLTLFCPDKYMNAGVLFLTALKIGLSGLTMAIFLLGRREIRKILEIREMREIPGKSGKTALKLFLVLMFSCSYALMSYTCVYSMCIMWLDGVFILPLLLHFTEKLIDRGQVLPFLLTLVYIFISNYYVAYMCGAFAAIYFIYYMIDRVPTPAERVADNDVRHAFIFNRAARFLLSALTAAGLSAWLLVPTFYSLKEGKIGGGNSDYSSVWNFSLTEFVRKLFIGEYDAITNRGAPFFYCGVAVFLMLPAFFCLRKVARKRKIASAAVLALLFFSLVYSEFDRAWHIFQHPNWFPYRWSFVFCFFVIFLAFRGALGWFSRDNLPISYFPGILAAALILGNISRTMRSDNPDKENVRLQFLLLCLISLFFLGAAVVKNLFAAGGQERGALILKRTGAVCIALLCIGAAAAQAFETGHHWKNLMKGLDRAHDYEIAANYTEYRETLAGLLAKAEEDRNLSGETEFAGIGQTFSRSYNEAIGFGYRSLAHYSSAYNREINEFLGNFGYSQAYLWNLNFGSTAVTDSLLGMRYTLYSEQVLNWDKEGKIEIGTLVAPSQYELLASSEGIGGVELYRNPWALTAPYLVTDEITDFRWQGNCFESQNLLLKLCSGLDKNVFTRVPGHNISVKLSQGAYQESGETDIYRCIGGKVTYTVELPEGGVLYAYFGRNKNGEARLTVGDGETLVLYRGETNCIQPLGSYAAGESAEFSITLGHTALYTEDNIYYVLDTEVLAEHIALIKARSMQLDSCSSSGTLKGSLAEGGKLLIPVSADGGWHVYVNGSEVHTEALCGGVLLADIPDGGGNVEIRYRARGLTAGLIISGVTVLVLAVYLAVKLASKSKKLSQKPEKMLDTQSFDVVS